MTREITRRDTLIGLTAGMGLVAISGASLAQGTTVIENAAREAVRNPEIR